MWKVVMRVYSIKELADLCGLSPRALRHFEALGLMRPQRMDNGYRVYGKNEVDRLQHLLFYRELGLPLKDIAKLLDNENFDRQAALREHLKDLQHKAARMTQLIATLERTIAHEEGKMMMMNDKEKFEGFKREQVRKNEEQYGKEVRQKYGDQAMDQANAKLMGQSKADVERVQALSEQVNKLLIKAVAQGDPLSDTARALCQAHKDWLMCYWTKYSKQAHAALGQMYVDDERFAKYYEDIVPGGANFLRDALAEFNK